RTEAAAVVWNGRVGDGAHGEACSGEHPPGDAVDWALHLPARVGQVEMDGAVADGGGDLDPDARVDIDAVVVEVVDGAIGAGLQVPEGGARHGLGAVEQDREGREQRVVAELRGRLAQAHSGDLAGGHLRVEIPHEDVGDAYVLAQHGRERLVEHARARPGDGGNADALLVDLGRV